MNGFPINEGTLYFLKYPLLFLMYLFLVLVIRAMVRQLPTEEDLSATAGTRGLPQAPPPTPTPTPTPTPPPPLKPVAGAPAPAVTAAAPTLPYTGPREWLEVLSGMPAPAGGIPVRGPILFGRSAECTVRVPDPFVSSRHARLTPDPDGAVLEDLGSRNGTLLGQDRLEGPVRLRDGDIFAVGDVTFRYRQVDDGA